jgi:hypothetical protein
MSGCHILQTTLLDIVNNSNDDNNNSNSISLLLLLLLLLLLIPLGRPRRRGWTILKWTLDRMGWIGLIWLRRETNGGLL